MRSDYYNSQSLTCEIPALVLLPTYSRRMFEKGKDSFSQWILLVITGGWKLWLVIEKWRTLLMLAKTASSGHRHHRLPQLLLLLPLLPLTRWLHLGGHQFGPLVNHQVILSSPNVRCVLTYCLWNFDVFSPTQKSIMRQTIKACYVKAAVPGNTTDVVLVLPFQPYIENS